MITMPGVYDIPEVEYFADPVVGGSLSRSEARLILDCPARLKWSKDHPQPPKRAFDFGHAAHQIVLGAGPDIVPVDADNWRKKIDQDQRDEAYAAGAVPLLIDEYEQVLAMAAVLRDHPVAGALFAPGTGWPEQTLAWQDKATDVWRRTRLDWLPAWSSGRMVLGDYKSAKTADPGKFARSMHDFGYDLQAATALDAVTALGLAGTELQPAFVCVVQEKDPPYLISVLEPDAEALMWARIRMEWALHTYRECTKNDHWPAYVDGVDLLPLPRYAARQIEAAYEAGRYDTDNLKQGAA